MGNKLPYEQIENDAIIKKIIEDVKFKQKIILHGDNSFQYFKNLALRKKINDLKYKLSTELYVNLKYNEYVKINDNFDEINMLVLDCMMHKNSINITDKLHTLELHNSNNITKINILNTLHTLDINYSISLKYINNSHSLQKLTMKRYNKVNDIGNMTSLQELDISHCINIKDVGSLRNLKILTVHDDAYGIHFLKKLEKITVMIRFGHKYGKDIYGKNIREQLKKLIKINPNVKVTIIQLPNPFLRVLSGMGGIGFSN